MRRIVKTLFAAGLVSAGVFAMPAAALATSTAGTRSYNIGTVATVYTTSSSSETDFQIYGTCNKVLSCEVGHGSVTRDVDAWKLVICDDKKDGITPYIDRDGGSYGASGAGTCDTVVAIPEHWRVRWDGAATPWFSMP